MQRIILTIVLFLSFFLESFAQIEEMHDFSVEIDGQLLPTYRCDVDMHDVQQASWCQFDMGKPVKVRIVKHGIAAKNNGKSVAVLPSRFGIKPDFENDSTISFMLSEPHYLSIEWNGDRKHNLHLFADKPETETYDGTEPRLINWQGEANKDVFIKNARIIYFGPGIHQPKDLIMGQQTGDIKIPSNTTVYLAPGAVVKGKLVVDHAKNVRILGRGVLDHPLRGVEITHSQNVLVEGITIVNPVHYTVYGGQSKNVTIRNIKSFSRHGWSDGIDLMSCQNVLIEDVFLRNSDDCIALYNHRWWFWGDTKNITVRRATLWADVAHPFHLGTHGDDRSEKGETLTNVQFSECDVLNEDGDGVFTIRCGDKNRISNIRFDDIRVDYVEKGRLFNLQVYFSDKYNRAPGNYVRNVYFSNIEFLGDKSRLQSDVWSDFDSQHRVSDVYFNNILINGQPVTPFAERGR